jgi:plastocyanin
VRRTLAIATAVGFAFAGTAGSAAAAQPAVTVNAAGNPFTGGLKFDPAQVTVRAGDTVRWVNTDQFVPHTATEDHGLWDLTGTYGQTPANPPGFGPGETRDRVFEAGTAHYYCKVHPQQMRGVVAVPVDLSIGPLVTATVSEARSVHRKHRTRHRRRTPAQTQPPPRAKFRLITAAWASAAPAKGQVFDVQRRLGDGAWQDWESGTGAAGGTFAARPGETWSVRARLRNASDPSAAEDFSPPASVSG